MSTYRPNSFKNKNRNINIYKNTYKGNKNTTILPDFITLCKKTQEELIEWLPKKLKKEGYDVIVEDGFIYAKGNIPVLLTAHMDTVHKEPVKDFYELEENGMHILSSPQGIGGDDRCGIYMILDIIKTHKCSVLFCEDEEIGAVGSKKFCKTDYINDLSNLYYLIELDRANASDAVFYDCNNPDFTEFITSYAGYEETYGSFSDISYLAPACGVAAVNLSCGYYHAHTLQEEVVIEEMLYTISIVKELITVSSKQFEYIEAKYDYRNYGYYEDYYYDYYNSKYYNNYKKNREVYLLVYTDNDCIVSEGSTEDEAWRNFYKNNPTYCYNDIEDFDYL